MGMLDMDISEFDVLKHSCIKFIKDNFNRLPYSPKYGKLGNVVYPNEFNIPSDIFDCPDKYTLFWGFGELPISYKPGITELDVIVKISYRGHEEMINRGDDLLYTKYNGRTRRIYPCINIKAILDGHFE